MCFFKRRRPSKCFVFWPPYYFVIFYMTAPVSTLMRFNKVRMRFQYQKTLCFLARYVLEVLFYLALVSKSWFLEEVHRSGQNSARRSM